MNLFPEADFLKTFDDKIIELLKKFHGTNKRQQCCADMSREIDSYVDYFERNEYLVLAGLFRENG